MCPSWGDVPRWQTILKGGGSAPASKPRGVGISSLGCRQALALRSGAAGSLSATPQPGWELSRSPITWSEALAAQIWASRSVL